MDMRNRHCGGVRQRYRTTAVARVFAREGFMGANRKRRLHLPRRISASGHMSVLVRTMCQALFAARERRADCDTGPA